MLRKKNYFKSGCEKEGETICVVLMIWYVSMNHPNGMLWSGGRN